MFDLKKLLTEHLASNHATFTYCMLRIGDIYRILKTYDSPIQIERKPLQHENITE